MMSTNQLQGDTTMEHNFLLVEGVNLYANIYDTDQLSIIRGSSFLYKDAVKHIETTFEKDLKAVSTGASSGLFCLKSRTPIKTVAGNVQKELRLHKKFQHLTFGVEHCTATNILQAKSQLWAQLHFHQLQSLMVIPDVSSDGHPSLNKPSGLEGVRIAATNARRKIQSDEGRDLSLSELVRWQYGRQKKRENSNFQFAPDIETLCRNSAYKKLNGKMAVVYVDGNDFGKRQRGFLENAIDRGSDGVKEQEDFDNTIQGRREDFLADILQQMQDGRLPDALLDVEGDEDSEGGKAIRLETLLWGGDEMLFVLPAWLGIDFLQQFFTGARSWTLPNGEGNLTHAAGIVFCQAKTPIRIIQNIARKLAERVKKKYGRDKDAWDYLVLESVDYPTSDDLNDYFKARYPAVQSIPTVACHAALDWKAAQVWLHDLFSKDGLPVRQIYRILNTFRDEAPQGVLKWADLFAATQESIQNASMQEKAEYQMLRTLDNNKRERIKVSLPALASALFGLNMDDAQQRAWCWLHLRELWDYLSPAKGEKA